MGAVVGFREKWIHRNGKTSRITDDWYKCYFLPALLGQCYCNLLGIQNVHDAKKVQVVDKQAFFLRWSQFNLACELSADKATAIKMEQTALLHVVRLLLPWPSKWIFPQHPPWQLPSLFLTNDANCKLKTNTSYVPIVTRPFLPVHCLRCSYLFVCNVNRLVMQIVPVTAIANTPFAWRNRWCNGIFTIAIVNTQQYLTFGVLQACKREFSTEAEWCMTCID